MEGGGWKVEGSCPAVGGFNLYFLGGSSSANKIYNPESGFFLFPEGDIHRSPGHAKRRPGYYINNARRLKAFHNALFSGWILFNPFGVGKCGRANLGHPPQVGAPQSPSTTSSLRLRLPCPPSANAPDCGKRVCALFPRLGQASPSTSGVKPMRILEGEACRAAVGDKDIFHEQEV